MHDGLPRISGLTAAQKWLASRLASCDFHSDEELAQDLCRLIAEQCLLPSVILPDRQADLFPADKLKYIETLDLTPFARDVLRGIESGERFTDSVSNALDIFLYSERRRLELRVMPRFECAVRSVMGRYDDAVSIIRRDLSVLLESFCKDGRIKVERAVRHLDLDAAIPGAELYV